MGGKAGPMDGTPDYARNLLQADAKGPHSAIGLFQFSKICCVHDRIETPDGELESATPELVFRIEVDRSEIRDASTGSREIGNAFGSLAGARAYGQVQVTYLSKSAQKRSLGTFRFDPPNPDTLLRLTLPMSRRLARLIGESGTKSRFELLPTTRLVVIEERISELGRVNIMERPPTGPILQRRKDGAYDPQISLEESTIDAIRDQLIPKLAAPGPWSDVLTPVRADLRAGRLGNAARMLRTLIMNRLTVPGNNSPRTLSVEAREVLTSGYADRGLTVREEVADQVMSGLRADLEILHKYLKDDKLVEEPSLEVLSYVLDHLVALDAMLAAAKSGSDASPGGA